jgi:hypothetical protein
MAISVSTIFEVRPTVGNDTNGGGYVTGSTGTDFSQQNSKNTGGSNISTTDGVTSGTGLTSATGTYSSAIVGNIIYLSGTGVTTGWYQAVSFATSTITLDRAPGNGTGITVNIGGALSTIAAANTNMNQSGMTTYVKATGTYTVTTTLTMNSANYGPPLKFIGYTSTRGDNGKVSWTTSTNSIALIEAAGASGVSFKNFSFTTTASTKANCFDTVTVGDPGGWQIRNCTIDGFAIGINGNWSAHWAFEGLVVEKTEVKNCVSHGILNSGILSLLGCAIHNNGGCGVLMHVATANVNCTMFAAFCAFKSNTSDGVQLDSYVRNGLIQILNCAFVNNSANGLNYGPGSGQPNFSVWNSIFYGNTLYGFFGVNNSVNRPGVMAFETNAYGANGSGAIFGIDADPSDITLTADPFANRTGTPPDLSLNSTAGGGAALTQVGTPGTLPFS